ncbi:MAG: TIGR03619 family F420-dependent LLM class oxidoreductase [Myxococcales bacterium]|nr:TIGR03619 family F420-dependent LLM class oxidoreductase [Myxococcales bacterium]
MSEFRVGLVLRNMGPQSTAETLAAGARAAEAAGIDDLWVTDHLAIPPDDAEGSGGRYLDPLATLAWLAGCTERIGLGTGVLNLPYRPPLPTAKAVATVQELSGGRLRLGIGVGWMRPEFRALGVDRGRRGALTDEMLAFLGECFAADEVTANGQTFLFKPRPPRPPIFVGGAPPHALARAARHGDGWMPMGGDPAALPEPIAELRSRFADAGRAEPEVVCMTGLPLGDVTASAGQLAAFRDVGVTRVAAGGRYDDADGFARLVDGMSAARERI